METTAMIWIDERRAVLRLLSATGERTLEVYSQPDPKPSAVASEPIACRPKPTTAPGLPSEPAGRSRSYFARVIAAMGNAGSVIISGPGEVKAELGRLLDEALTPRRSLVMVPISQSTERQMAARARDHLYF